MLERLLKKLCDRHGIPGLAAAFYAKGTRRRASCGVVNIETALAVSDSSLFQIGSITKPFTATLVMRAVEDGTISLDEPIRHYLPALRIAGAPASEAITVRRLLSHTGGVDGDFFISTGRNDDAIARFVQRAEDIPMIAEPGAILSYSNAGYVILGRILEIVGNDTWSAQLQCRVLEPLELKHSCNDPEQSPQFSVVNGHTLDAGTNRLRLARPSFLSRSMEPAGSRLMMSASDLLSFAVMHLREGVAENGARLVANRTAMTMRDSVERQPEETGSGTGFGLGWMVFEDWHPAAFGHDGATNGQSSFLRIIPEWEFAVAFLANADEGMQTKQAFQTFLKCVTSDLGELSLPPEAEPKRGAHIDRQLACGTYESVGEIAEITEDRGRFCATLTPKLRDGGADKATRHGELRAIDERRAMFEGEDGAKRVMTFVGLDRLQRAQYLSQGFRVLRRQD